MGLDGLNESAIECAAADELALTFACLETARARNDFHQLRTSPTTLQTATYLYASPSQNHLSPGTINIALSPPSVNRQPIPLHIQTRQDG